MYPSSVPMGGFNSTQPSVPPAPTLQAPEPNGSLASPPPSINAPSSRDWDSQSTSAFSESNTGHSNGVNAGSVASMGLPPNQMDLMRDTVNKRIMTLTYLRSTHEGSVSLCRRMCGNAYKIYSKMYWFNTVLLTREELSETFNHPSMKKRYAGLQLLFRLSPSQFNDVHLHVNYRAYRFAVLAMSLASLFDIQTPSEYLKALTALIMEYEAFQDETVKPKVGNWRASARGRNDADR
jgi:hypothetical protein